MSSLPPTEARSGTREELLKTLDRESAIARATEGRIAVLVIELRRVDRMQALLRGPGPAITMSLVLDRLRRALRSEDRIAALGDDQVCVLLPRLSHPSQAVLAAVKLLRALDRPIAHEGGSAVLRPCVGIATLPEQGFDPAELLMAADVSRQIAATREEGYHVFQPDDAVETQLYHGLDLDLERALRGNELDLRYEPQSEIATGNVVGLEAQLRWRHAEAGEVPTATIHAMAERTGQAGQLTFWMLNTALRQLAQWRDAGISTRLTLGIAAANLEDREFPSLVDQGLKTWGIAPASLTLALPESAMVAIVESERQQAMLTRLEGAGARLAIDDFGSGFTALVALQRMPLDALRIDRGLVAALGQASEQVAVAAAAIDIARRFGLVTVALGVGDAATLEQLRNLGCERAQGPAIGRHMTSANVREQWGHVIKPAP